MEPVSVKCLTQVRAHTHVHTQTQGQWANTCSLRQHTEPVWYLSSLIKPVRMILCTDEDSFAIRVIAPSHLPMQSKEEPYIFNYITYFTAMCRNLMEMNILLNSIQYSINEYTFKSIEVWTTYVLYDFTLSNFYSPGAVKLPELSKQNSLNIPHFTRLLLLLLLLVTTIYC